MEQSFLNFVISQAPQIAKQTLTHIQLVLFSIFFAVIIGVPLGLFLSGKKKAGTLVLGLTGILQTVPSIAMLGLMLPLWGIGVYTATAALFLYALLPIIRNTITGMDQVDSNMKEAAIAMGLTKWQLLKKIEIPLSTPMIFSGIRTASVINVGVATLAAYVAAGGLGEFIFGGIALNNTNMILAGAIPAAILAIIFDLILAGLQLLPIQKLMKVLGLLIIFAALSTLALFWNKSDKRPLLAGLAHEFAGRADGYPGLQKKYGLKLSTVLIDQSLMYKALHDGKLDIISGYSTDGRIKSYKLKVLKDDKHAFPLYQAALIIRKDILFNYPELKNVLELLTGSISDSEMTDMNYRAEILHQTPHHIASNFITRKNLLGTNKEKKKKKILLGSKIFTEQYILSEIITILIESHTNLQVEQKKGLGGTKICFSALQLGHIDLYPEYTGTGLQVILGVNKATNVILNNHPHTIINFLDSTFQNLHQLKWIAPLGFNNTYCLMMQEYKAKSLRLEKISDLVEK